MSQYMAVPSGLAACAPPRRMSSPVCWLSFPRIIDIPFETCLATLQRWQRAGQDGELPIGLSLLR